MYHKSKNVKNKKIGGLGEIMEELDRQNSMTTNSLAVEFCGRGRGLGEELILISKEIS